MICGLGLDIVEISRIARTWERFGLRFALKILHPDEMIQLEKRASSSVQFLASRFAVKEAAVKALGTGFAQGVLPTEIAVESHANGKPELRLSGCAEQQMRRLGATSAHLSLTHGKETVAAVVILEKEQP